MYDEETCFYYLRTRYYDPYIGRFLNADGYVSTGTGLGGYNMFAYCGGNPINRADPTGQLWDFIWKKIKEKYSGLRAVFVFAAIIKRSNKKTNNSSNSSSSELTEEQKHFVATVASEAIGENKKTQKAVAHTIMNRFYEPRDRWRHVTSVSDVLIWEQFRGIGGNQYILCMNYLNNRDGSNVLYENLIDTVIPIYYGQEADFTGGAHFIFNVQESQYLYNSLKAQPQRYYELGPFEDIDPVEYCMFRCGF